MTRLALAFGAACLLAACGRPATEATEAAAAPDIGQPALWSVETLGANQAVASTVVVCTDTAIRAAFSRSLPATDSGPCVLIDQPVIATGRFAARCRADGSELTVLSDARGDLARDFTVETVITSENGERRTFEQTSRFRQIGPCPADWAVGDSAAPGDTQIVNALSGAVRTGSAPAPGG